MQQPWSWVLHAYDAYQSLTGSAYLPLSSRQLQLRTKRFSRSSRGIGSLSGDWRWKGSSGPSSILCGVLVLVPWISLVLLTVLLWRAKLQGGFPLVVNDIPGGRQCTGWKQTYFCHPFA